MMKRTIYKEIVKTNDNYPVTVITGARQVGKTTLVEKIRKEYSGSTLILVDKSI